MMNTFFFQRMKARRNAPSLARTIRCALRSTPFEAPQVAAGFAPQLMMHEQREKKDDRKRNSD